MQASPAPGAATQVSCSQTAPCWQRRSTTLARAAHGCPTLGSATHFLLLWSQTAVVVHRSSVPRQVAPAFGRLSQVRLLSPLMFTHSKPAVQSPVDSQV